MQTAVERSPLTVQERSVEATRRLREAVGGDDLKLLATALAEAAVEEMQHNAALTLRVRDKYEQLSALKGAGRSTRTHARLPAARPTPIASAGDIRIDPHAPLDPYILLKLYGPSQLKAALDGYSMNKLKEAATLVQQRHPGTRPRDKRRADAVIDYIVEHVAGTAN